jgi:ligand-binding sensor domain-containing protein/two-component sensor histidine kinase
VRCRIALFFILFSVNLFAVQAQSELIYSQLGVEQGLPSTHVNRLTMGKRGFLWASTDHGFGRFDGQSFRTFGYADGLTNLNVYGLAQSADSSMWICTRGGGLFRLKAGLIKQYRPQPGTIPQELTDIAIDGKDNKWVLSTSNELVFIQGNTAKKVVLPRSAGAAELFSLMAVGNNIQIATSHGVLMAADGIVQPEILFSGRSVYCIDRGPGNSIYYGASGMIFRSRNGIMDSFNLPEKKPVLALAINDKGKIFGITTGTGFFDISGTVCHDISASVGLQDALVDDLIFDEQGNLHLATFGRGIYSIYSLDVHKLSSREGLLHDNVTSIAEDDKGRIYAGTYGGLSIMVRDAVSSVSRNIDPDEMISQLLFANGKMQIGRMLRVHRFDRFLSPEHNPDDILSLAWDGREYLLGTWNGVRSVQKDCKDLISCSAPSEEYRNIRGPVYFIRIDPSGNAWIGTPEGLYRYGKNGKETVFNAHNGLPVNKVNDIAFGSGDKVYVATDFGIAEWTGRGWKNYSSANGLGNTTCSALLMANDGTLWTGTMRGIYFLPPGNSEFEKFTLFPSMHINCFFQAKNGLVWAGTDEGIFNFPVSIRQRDQLIPKLYIIRMNTEKGFVYNFHNPHFSFRNNNIQINYLTIDFQPGAEILYQYKVNDEPQWQETGNRTLQFSNLDPGHYRVRIRAHYRGSKIFTDSVSCDFTIMNPFWQEWWFILAALLALGLFITWIIALRIQRIRRKAQLRARRMNRMIRLRQQAMNALVNPHFIFNSLNSIQHFINQSDNLSANRYLTRFARLIRKTMDSSGQMFVSLEDEIERLQLYISLEKMRLGNKLNYEIEAINIEDKNSVKIPAMLIQPYVENAIWHGIMPLPEGGTVWIRFIHESERLIIVIEDNGVGIKPKAPQETRKELKKLHGMQINLERLRMIDPHQSSIRTVNLAETGGQGTRVEIDMPYLIRKQKG